MRQKFTILVQAMPKNSRLVYSTETGRTCPKCEKPIDDCICGKDTAPEGDGIVRIQRESKGRGGKTVTTISGVLATKAELKKLCAELKKHCGVGGAVKDSSIELQGDQRNSAQHLLAKKGFKVKLSGG